MPRLPAEPEQLPDPWQTSKIRPALHGLLYALPTVCFPAAAGLLDGPGVLDVLIVVLLVSWATSQGLGLPWLSAAGPGGTRGRRGGCCGPGWWPGWPESCSPSRWPAWRCPPAFRRCCSAPAWARTCWAPPCCWCCGAERLLLVVLAPGVLGSAAFLAARASRCGWTMPAWAALAATPLLALALAWRRARPPGHWPAPPGRPRQGTRPACGGASRPGSRLFVAAELRGALPSAGFGLVAAGLLAFPVAAGVRGLEGANTGACSPRCRWR